MGIIQVRTPNQGVVKVRIAGDKPTTEELQNIKMQFSPPETATESIKKPDLSTATFEEIETYKRELESRGIDPASGEKLTEDEFIRRYKEPGVDYSSGVDGVEGFSRFQYGRMETDEEKANYLNSVVGKDGYREDMMGRFILTKKGRKKLGMKDGPEIAVDEEGFSFADVKDFAGQAGLPILAGIGATIAASGLGIIPGTLVVGGATALGKLLDEGIETVEGFQRQSPSDVARDAAIEGVFGAGGELFGRTLSGIFGRIIKGPGGEANEALRARAREVIEKGYRPTIAGATDESFRPVLNRLQAVYEGIFPNKKAADVNLGIIVKELEGLGLGKQVTKDLSKVVQRDIDTVYGKADDLVTKTQLELDKGIAKEIDKIIKPLKEGDEIPKDLADMIKKRKAIFDEDIDRLYTKVSQTLNGQKIINTATLKDKVKSFANSSVFADEIKKSGFYKKIEEMGGFTSVDVLNKVRRQLDELTYSPDFIGSTKRKEFNQIKKAISDSFDEAQIELAIAAGKPLPLGAKIISGPELTGVGMKEAAEALNIFRKTNRLYNSGMKRFDNVGVAKIMGLAKDGKISFKDVMDKIIDKDNPEALDQLFKAIRGIPAKKALGAEKGLVDLDAGRRILEKQTVAGQPIKDIKAKMELLNPGDPNRKTFEKIILDKEQDALINNTIRGTGAELADETRQGLAKMWLQEGLDQSIRTQRVGGTNIYDPVALSKYIRSKGSTVKKLFGDDIGQLDDLVRVLERTKPDLSKSVVDEIMSLPLGRSLIRMKDAIKAKADLDKDRFLFDLKDLANDPEALSSKVFKDAGTIKRAKEILEPDTFETVQDAAMGKILRGMGATTGEGGAIKLTDDFIDKFKNGALGKELKRTLNGYGKETINTMFDNPQAFASLDALSETMIQVSNKAIAGKGGLAAPSIALGLGLLGVIASPFAALTTIAGYSIASKALRNPKVLKMMMASKKPNTIKQFLDGKFVTEDPVGQGFQTLLALTSAGTGRTIQMTGEEVAPTKEAIQETIAPVSEAIEEVKPQLASQASNALKQVEQDKLLGIN